MQGARSGRRNRCTVPGWQRSKGGFRPREKRCRRVRSTVRRLGSSRRKASDSGSGPRREVVGPVVRCTRSTSRDHRDHARGGASRRVVSRSRVRVPQLPGHRTSSVWRGDSASHFSSQQGRDTSSRSGCLASCLAGGSHLLARGGFLTRLRKPRLAYSAFSLVFRTACIGLCGMGRPVASKAQAVELFPTVFPGEKHLIRVLCYAHQLWKSWADRELTDHELRALLRECPLFVSRVCNICEQTLDQGR